MLNGLSLFSGIGGIDLALDPWVRAIAYCEIDSYCHANLLSRMFSGGLPLAPVFTDVTALTGRSLPEVDIIFGGFPCQDLSVAGRGKGLAGERSGLFYQIARLAAECEAPFLFLENVPAIRTRGGEAVGKVLAGLGYDCRWDVVSAAEVGANHLRQRWFLLAAHPERLELRLKQGRGSGEDREGPAFPRDDGATRALGPGWWAVEPDVGRMAYGVPHRVDRIRTLGNAVVPLQAQTAFKRLMGIE